MVQWRTEVLVVIYAFWDEWISKTYHNRCSMTWSCWRLWSRSSEASLSPPWFCIHMHIVNPGLSSCYKPGWSRLSTICGYWGLRLDNALQLFSWKNLKQLCRKHPKFSGGITTLTVLIPPKLTYKCVRYIVFINSFSFKLVTSCSIFDALMLTIFNGTGIKVEVANCCAGWTPW